MGDGEVGELLCDLEARTSMKDSGNNNFYFFIWVDVEHEGVEGMRGRKWIRFGGERCDGYLECLGKKGCCRTGC